MKVTDAAANRFKHDVISKVASNVKVLICSHVEWKLVNLAAVLKEAGADVTVVGNNPWTCKPACVEQLESLKIQVYSTAHCTMEQTEALIAEAAQSSYQYIFDDGAQAILSLKSNNAVISCTEFTMSGGDRLRSKLAAVTCPVYDLNSSFTKHCIGNEYGTGVSTLCAFQMITNVSVAGMRVGIVGYGPVGKSVAKVFQGAGAITFVSEVDLTCWKRAELDGHHAVDIEELGRNCDLIITCTGKRNVISEGVFRVCKDGVILANVGHFNFEIDTDHLAAESVEIKAHTDKIKSFRMKSGRTINLLCDGSLLNISGGMGFPIEIIDLSFAAAVNCWSYSYRLRAAPGLHLFPAEVDQMTLEDADSRR